MRTSLREHDENDIITAIAIGEQTEARRFQMVQAIIESGGFDPVKPHLTSESINQALNVLERCAQLRLEVWPITSPSYPALLRETSAPPAVLYVHTLDPRQAIPERSVGVVGTRSASIEICQHATNIGFELARAGLTVISGLALGIDGAAHRGALQAHASCPTVAVLAHGLDRVYPPSHAPLARQILDAGGMIVSEYAPGVEPMRHHFLARNRIIAGLSRGVVVVQAGARSGSLVTANFAADYGRDVFVVANPESQEERLGGEKLLDQGAIAIRSARDVLREYNLLPSESQQVEDGEWLTMTVDSFLAITELSPAMLLKLELEGRVARVSGNRIMVSPSLISE